jgi:hypothetical protein
MSPKDKIQKNGPSSHASLSTSPNTPSGSPSSNPFTMNDVYSFIEMAKAVIAMQATSTITKPHCTCPHTPPGSPALQSSSTPVTLEHLEQLFLKLMSEKFKLSDSNSKSAKSKGSGDTQDKKVRASKLEFKVVNEMYVSK